MEAAANMEHFAEALKGHMEQFGQASICGLHWWTMLALNVTLRARLSQQVRTFGHHCMLCLGFSLQVDLVHMGNRQNPEEEPPKAADHQTLLQSLCEVVKPPHCNHIAKICKDDIVYTIQTFDSFNPFRPCLKALKPKVGFDRQVRFSTPEAAQRAMEAINAGQVVIDGMLLKAWQGQSRRDVQVLLELGMIQLKNLGLVEECRGTSRFLKSYLAFWIHLDLDRRSTCRGRAEVEELHPLPRKEI